MPPSHQHLISLSYSGQVWKPFDFLCRLNIIFIRQKFKAHASASSSEIQQHRNQYQHQPKKHEKQMLTGKRRGGPSCFLLNTMFPSSSRGRNCSPPPPRPLPRPRPRAAIVLQIRRTTTNQLPALKSVKALPSKNTKTMHSSHNYESLVML